MPAAHASILSDTQRLSKEFNRQLCQPIYFKLSKVGRRDESYNWDVGNGNQITTHCAMDYLFYYCEIEDSTTSASFSATTIANKLSAAMPGTSLCRTK